MQASAPAAYGNYSPNDFPMYGIRDASRYLKIPSATVRSWFVGTKWRTSIWSGISFRWCRS